MKNPRGTRQPSCGFCTRIHLHSGLVLRHRDVQEVTLGRLWSGLASNQEMATKQGKEVGRWPLSAPTQTSAICQLWVDSRES